jgi:hypothetical protein
MIGKIIIIAGSGRSGTTWVQDSLAQSNDFRTIFEPLHPVGVPASSRYSNQYVDAKEDAPALKKFMDQVLSGQYPSIWMNYRIRPDRLNVFHVGIEKSIINLIKLFRHYRKYHLKGHNGIAVKFIRANLMLSWLARQYDYPILFVTRHPCAVIASRINLGGKDWASMKMLKQYQSNQDIVDLIKCEFGLNINQTFSTIQALTCVWCIENILPLQWARVAGYTVTSYESLLRNPETEWQYVTHGLGLPHAPDKSLLELPSQQASSGMRGARFTDSHLARWRKVLNADQIGEVSSVLELFSYAGYTVDSNMPTESYYKETRS